jgi:hypothetical protein
MIKDVAFIHRTHGLDGAVFISIPQYSCIDSVELLKNAQKNNEPVFIDDEQFFIERLFGCVKINKTVKYRIKFVDCDFYSAKQLCNKVLSIEYKGLDYDALIGVVIVEDNRRIAQIEAVYDFGAGIVCDTNVDMYSINDLDLSTLEQGFVIKK